MSHVLLLPGNNTLSHVAKALVLRSALQARGHTVSLAINAARADFLHRNAIPFEHVLPDLQDADGGNRPSSFWFRPEHVERVLRAELELLRRLRPNRVLGVFRFTAPISAALAGIPYDSVSCGAMLPTLPGPLGFHADESGAAAQAEALDFFRRSCARRMNPALARLGHPPVADLLELQFGARTYLWDYPEFQPLPAAPDVHHLGPLFWSGWPASANAADARGEATALDALRGPLAFVAFGTGHAPPPLLRRLIDVLWTLGYAVALALGGQPAAAVLAALPQDPTRLAVFDFLPAERVLPRAALVVCHGGQLLVFEALAQRVPVFVLPLQPEQAQNGVCLERLGCGLRLLAGLVYVGDPGAVDAAFLARPTAAVADDFAAVLAAPETPERLAAIAAAQARYRGAEALADHYDADR